MEYIRTWSMTMTKPTEHAKDRVHDHLNGHGHRRGHDHCDGHGHGQNHGHGRGVILVVVTVKTMVTR